MSSIISDIFYNSKQHIIDEYLINRNQRNIQDSSSAINSNHHDYQNNHKQNSQNNVVSISIEIHLKQLLSFISFSTKTQPINNHILKVELQLGRNTQQTMIKLNNKSFNSCELALQQINMKQLPNHKFAKLSISYNNYLTFSTFVPIQTILDSIREANKIGNSQNRSHGGQSKSYREIQLAFRNNQKHVKQIRQISQKQKQNHVFSQQIKLKCLLKIVVKNKYEQINKSSDKFLPSQINQSIGQKNQSDISNRYLIDRQKRTPQQNKDKKRSSNSYKNYMQQQSVQSNYLSRQMRIQDHSHNSNLRRSQQQAYYDALGEHERDNIIINRKDWSNSQSYSDSNQKRNFISSSKQQDELNIDWGLKLGRSINCERSFKISQIQLYNNFKNTNSNQVLHIFQVQQRKYQINQKVIVNQIQKSGLIIKIFVREENIKTSQSQQQKQQNQAISQKNSFKLTQIGCCHLNSVLLLNNMLNGDFPINSFNQKNIQECVGKIKINKDLSQTKQNKPSKTLIIDRSNYQNTYQIPSTIQKCNKNSQYKHKNNYCPNKKPIIIYIQFQSLILQQAISPNNTQFSLQKSGQCLSCQHMMIIVRLKNKQQELTKIIKNSQDQQKIRLKMQRPHFWELFVNQVTQIETQDQYTLQQNQKQSSGFKIQVQIYHKHNLLTYSSFLYCPSSQKTENIVSVASFALCNKANHQKLSYKQNQSFWISSNYLKLFSIQINKQVHSDNATTQSRIVNLLLNNKGWKTIALQQMQKGQNSTKIIKQIIKYLLKIQKSMTFFSLFSFFSQIPQNYFVQFVLKMSQIVVQNKNNHPNNSDKQQQEEDNKLMKILQDQLIYLDTQKCGLIALNSYEQILKFYSQDYRSIYELFPSYNTGGKTLMKPIQYLRQLKINKLFVNQNIKICQSSGENHQQMVPYLFLLNKNRIQSYQTIQVNKIRKQIASQQNQQIQRQKQKQDKQRILQFYKQKNDDFGKLYISSINFQNVHKLMKCKQNKAPNIYCNLSPKVLYSISNGKIFIEKEFVLNRYKLSIKGNQQLRVGVEFILYHKDIRMNKSVELWRGVITINKSLYRLDQRQQKDKPALLKVEMK